MRFSESEYAAIESALTFYLEAHPDNFPVGDSDAESALSKVANR